MKKHLIAFDIDGTIVSNLTEITDFTVGFFFINVSNLAKDGIQITGFYTKGNHA